ncbi:Hypothetical protein PHPALM_2234 [Phytophthora palmivora]|uniref:Uncharacterized protein n=1 Tax=Phytophthora palmivora TaxID=4796 RepID=A0A2P4YQ93_9STRA|nr:Hypothetical protein PHPALM_2234 [Phytophthora palmivora]
MVSITLTCNTLRRAFPHLNSNEHGDTNGGVWSPLAARMLGQKLVLRGFVQFGWDDATDKVVRLHFQADMMTPMVKLLGSLSDVAFFLA